MPVVIVATSEFSIFEANMPSATDVAAAMRKYTPRTNPIMGNWVGPAPRVTRKAVFGGFETDVVWPYQWPDTPYSTQNLPTLQQTLHGEVADGLNELSSTWSDPILTPYSPALNGPLSFWTSGQATQTTTRNVPATGIARITDPSENPVGPTTTANRPSTPADAWNQLTSSPWLWVGVTALGLVIAWPYLKPMLHHAD